MSRKTTSDEDLRLIVQKASSINDVLRMVGCKISGGSHSHYSNRIRKLGISINHFKGKSFNSGRTFSNRKKASEEILVLRSGGNRQKSSLLVRAMLENNIPHQCAKCNCPPEWMGNPLTLDVDHINQNWLDDRIENLRFLCPNCHSQYSRKLLGN